MKRIHFFLKFIFDYFCSIFFILFFWPLILIIVFFIKIDSKGPAIYLQKRVGRKGKDFVLYKFRTMIQNAENQGDGIYCGDGDNRLTRVGKWLRKFSLDEIPQLFNVLKGEMSLVGPRPTLRYQVDKYTPYHMRRLEMKPGITGWAQVNGRNAIPWSKRIDLDIWYIDHFNFFIDLKILFKTVFPSNNDKIYGNKNIFDL